jgi:hypothetical protein
MTRGARIKRTSAVYALSGSVGIRTCRLPRPQPDFAFSFTASGSNIDTFRTIVIDK